MDLHGPVRTCIGCRRRRPQSALVRITRAGGDLVVDGPSSGRGAWLCRGDAGCVDVAIGHKQFERAWRVTLDDDDVGAVRAALRADEHTD